MQGRIFSYMDTQLNRHGGPNFEQLPINRPRVPIHSNVRDGAGQMYIPLNNAPYSPNTVNNGSPRQANQTQGRGFFTSNRSIGGKLVRAVSSTFADVWSQPRLFYNSLQPVEQQLLINAMRFETAQLTSDVVKNNVLIQINRISHDVAVRVAEVLNMKAPEADNKYYHNNKTVGLSIVENKLLKIDGLTIGYLTSATASKSVATSLKAFFKAKNVKVLVVAERLGEGIDQTYTATFAGNYDAIVADGSVDGLFAPTGSLSNSTLGNNTAKAMTTLYPAGRPMEILLDGYRWGKPIALLGANAAFDAAGIKADTPGMYAGSGDNDTSTLAAQLSDGLYTFKFMDRYPLDQ